MQIHKLAKIRVYFILNNDFILNNNNNKNAVPQDHYLPKSQSGLGQVIPLLPGLPQGSKSLLSGLPSRQGWPSSPQTCMKGL